MPNHVTHILTLDGSTKDVEQLKTTLLNEDGEIDFNLAFPMPDELKNTASPTRIITQKEYDNQDMNSTFGKGITKKMSKEFISKYGVDNWYDWKLENWGTKWGGYNSFEIDENTFEFLTAWSTPVPFFEKLSVDNPNVTIIVKYADEDLGYNVGEYHLLNGEIINEYQPDGGSFEAYELAIELHGGDECWVMKEFLSDDIEDETVDEAITTIKNGGNSFESVALLMAYKYKNVSVDYPVNLLNFLLDKAVENEDYLYACELRDTITEKQKELKA